MNHLYAVIVNDSEVLSRHTTLEAAHKQLDRLIALPWVRTHYLAHRRPDGCWETRLEALDRRGAEPEPFLDSTCV